ncbi:MAG: GntR family transcriptional regulator [Tissierellia bacterium]|nr:GntR family transcriptional regulator [Tissierellia bacterium]
MDAFKEKNKISTIKQQVYDIIKENILNGTFEQGEWLQEKKLAEMLDVSRSPVREALKELVGEGLLENIPNKGVFVRKYSKKDIDNIFELREILEKYAIKKIIEESSDIEIGVLINIFNEMEDSYNKGDLLDYYKIDTIFHATLYYMCENEILDHMVSGILPIIQPTKIGYKQGMARFGKSLEEHRGIVDGIKERNFEKALKYQKIHLDLAKEETIKNLEIKD